MIEVSPEEKFQKWYLNSLNTLYEKMDHGDGGIAALMIVMPLFERYLTPKIPTDKKQEEQTKVRESIICEEFGFKSNDQAAKFWNVFRDGLCHSGSFFERSRTSTKKGLTLPKVALGGQFSEIPVFDTNQKNEEIITLNPWKFAYFVIQKYKDDPSLLTLKDAPLLPLFYQVTLPEKE